MEINIFLINVRAAYDTINRQELVKNLTELVFSAKYVKLVNKSCISLTTKYKLSAENWVNLS